MGDNGGDVGGDTRWMTYAELAQARGIKEPAAVRLVQRRSWERQMGNDGSARIAVPVSALRPSKPVAPAVMPVAPDRQGMAEAEALARERARADRAEARADAAHAAADRAGREREAALIRAAAAEGEAAALREALTYARRPAWRRWLGIE